VFSLTVSAIPDRGGLALLDLVADSLLVLVVVFPLAPVVDSLPALVVVFPLDLAAAFLLVLVVVFPLVLAAASLLALAADSPLALAIIGAASPCHWDIDCKVFKLELYVKPKKRDAQVTAGFTNLYKDRGIKLTCRKTDELYDSVWIVDSTLAFVIGASFNGLALLRERTSLSNSA
jgi:hypothetical protein